MALIKPFRAYRPKPEVAARVASVPYDVVNTAEARQLAEGNPYSFLRVCRPEIDFPEGTDEHDERVYAKGAENLKKFISEGTLIRERTQGFYVYQQRMGDHIQAGLVVLCPVKEYEQGHIKKHELTRADKEDDRTRHVTDQNANAEPVFLAYRAKREIDAIVDSARTGPPVIDIVTPDRIGHTAWEVDDPQTIAALVQHFSGVDALYIADGHHRTAAAVRYGQAQREKNPDPKGDEPYEFFMAVLFPHDQLKILDYNRLVKDLNGLKVQEFLAKVREKFDVLPGGARSPRARTTFGMFLAGKWHTLVAKAGSFPAGDVIRSLDLSILQENLLAPVLGIQDQRTDKRIDFVGGIRGMDELERRVREGWAVAFSVFPVSLQQLMAVADAGQIMPPKSTWFEPKLRSGLLVRLYEND